MEARLHAAGIHTVEALCAARKEALHAVWGGVLGDRLWHLLRGDEIPDLVSARKSIGHTHVLPPDERHPDRAWPVICKLLHKACERLRSHGMLAGSLVMQVSYLRGPKWSAETRVPESDGTVFFMRQLERLWRDRPDPRASFIQVGIVLGKLVEKGNYTPELFSSGAIAGVMAAEDEKQSRLDETLDALRQRYGRRVIYYGNVHHSRDSAPLRISFTHIPDVEVEG